jgi:hypothetical protein
MSALTLYKSEKDRYEDLLKNFDWQFEFSSEHSVWREYKDKLAELKRLQPKVDPDRTIWNKYYQSMF